MNKGTDINEEGKAKELLEPVLESSQDLLMSYGFTEQDLIDEFGSLDNENLIMNAMAILDISSAYVDNGGVVYNNRINLFVQSVNAQTYADFKHCLLDATGIAGAAILIQEGIKGAIKKLGKKAVLKIVGKVVARNLGWVGAVWAVADFSKCMFDKRSQINNQ